MSKIERKFTIGLFLVIIVFSSILIFKINNNKYDKEMYELVYSQNNEIMTNTTLEVNKERIKNKNVTRVYKNATGYQYAIAGNISIDKISIVYPIIKETTEENLKIAPTKLAGPSANEVGNFCITGHNYKNSTHFSNLKNLENGDIVKITDLYKKTVEYEVYDSYEINPDELECLNQDTNGKREVTLITCAKNNKKRLVIKCREIKG